MYLVIFLTLGKIKYCPPKKLGPRKFEKKLLQYFKKIICEVKKKIQNNEKEKL